MSSRDFVATIQQCSDLSMKQLSFSVVLEKKIHSISYLNILNNISIAAGSRRYKKKYRKVIKLNIKCAGQNLLIADHQTQQP